VQRCRSRKRSYVTELDAMLALHRIWGQRDIDSLEKHERRCYGCTQCGRYHLTSQHTIEGEL
jgi:hypothetical protein